MKTKRLAILTAAALACLGTFAWAHPTIEGGIKNWFSGVKGLYGSHVEIVADARANQIRLYISQAEDEKLTDGKKHEWVIPMTVRNGKAGADEVVLLPLPDPGADKEWFPVTPVESRNGYVFYRIEATGKIVLDGDTAKRQAVNFLAARDSRGTACLAAAMDLSRAKSIRFEELKIQILDAQKAKPATEKILFTGTSWGIGGLHKNLSQKDLPLKDFGDALAKSPEHDKYRKPQAPAMAPEKSKPKN